MKKNNTFIYIILGIFAIIGIYALISGVSMLVSNGTSKASNETVMAEITRISKQTNSKGEATYFVFVDYEYEGVEYLVLAPEEDDSGEIVILEIEPVDEENENYLAVEDEEVLNAVFAIFKEKFKDVLEFEN